MNFKLPAGGIVGVIGANGAGKTTLFRMLTGQEKPDGGTLKVGSTVQMGYVDQSRDALDPNKTVWQEISGGTDIIEFGKTKINSRAYTGAFAFKGGDQQKKVGQLSGGERNRVHLAKMLKSGANLLLLDEPTNDLDVDTLRALETALEEFAGCAMIISHDRWFLDRIATHMLAFEGDSHVEWFEGNFQDYEADKKRRLGVDADQPHRIKYKRFARLAGLSDDCDADVATAHDAKAKRLLCRRLAEIGGQIAQMRDQGADIAVVLAQEGDELVALLQRQPDALIGHIHQHRLAGVGAHPEIHFRRLLAGTGIDQIGLDDEVGGRALGRADHLQGLVGVFGEIGLIGRGRVILEGVDEGLHIVRRGAAAILAQGEQRDAAHIHQGQQQAFELVAALDSWKAACRAGSPAPCGCSRPQSFPRHWARRRRPDRPAPAARQHIAKRVRRLRGVEKGI